MEKFMVQEQRKLGLGKLRTQLQPSFEMLFIFIEQTFSKDCIMFHCQIQNFHFFQLFFQNLSHIIYLLYNQLITKKMSSQTADFLNKYLNNFLHLKAIIIADNQGIHICSAFAPDVKAESQKSQKFIETSVLLIQALNQADNNLIKINSNHLMKVANYYFGDYLIHVAKQKNMKITLFFNKNSTIMNAKQISTDLFKVYEHLNTKILQIKNSS